MGTLHGLAGSSHLFGVLPTLAFTSRADGLWYLAAFGVGAVLAMTGFAAVLGVGGTCRPPHRGRAGPSSTPRRPPPCSSAGRGSWRDPRRRRCCPASAAATAVMLAGFALADGLGRLLLAAFGLQGASPISGVAVAIVLGLLIRNLLPLPAALGVGLKFCTTTVLRLGIVLVGIKLSVIEMARLGAAGVPVVLAAIATGLLLVTRFNRRLGLPPRLGTLIAAGTSICGVTAIVSTAPAIDADERDVAYAVANVVAFGLFGMLVYPYLAHALLPGSAAIGLFLGTAVHDTSQVVGAALTYRQLYGDDVVLRVATVTKLTRNLFLAAVIPLLTWMHHRSAQAGSPSQARPPRHGVRWCPPSCSASSPWRSCARSATRCSAPAGRRLASGMPPGGRRSPRWPATPSAPAGCSARRWRRSASTPASRCSRASG